jgi:hypothetical protein
MPNKEGAMKRLVLSRNLMMHTLLNVGILLFLLAGQGQAALYCNAGNCAHVQNEDVLVSPIIYYGWGTDFFVKDFNYTWAHIPVPLPYTATKGVNYVQVEVQVIGTYGKVSEVHVYSGGALLKKFNVNWGGPNNNYFVKLNLGSVKTVSGPISISLKCETGDGSTRFVIKRACANLVNK